MLLVKNECQSKKVSADKQIEKIICDLQDVKLVEPNLETSQQIGNKSLSKLKKVNGVIDYFQEIKKNKQKESVTDYLLDLVTDKVYLNRCQDFNNICYIRLPIIVIDKDYYYDFITSLSSYYKYEKYNKNPTLAKYLILCNNDINNYEVFHSPLNSNYKFAAECINTALITHYNSDQIYKINKLLNDFFKENNINGLDIDLYYSAWINKVIDIFFEFILYKYYESPKIIECERCKKKAIFTSENFNFYNMYEERIYEDMEENETYEKTVYIANNMINNLDFSKINFSSNEEQTKVDNTSVNLIYYDENIDTNRNEIIGDSFVFEKESNGTLILVSNIKSMLLLLNEFKKCKECPKFHLICTGSKFENLMSYLQRVNDINNYIVSVCIYTFDVKKYSYLLPKFKIVKGIYNDRDEVVEYIKKNKIKDNIRYKQSQLITFYDYKDKYIEFHKIISMQYGKLYQKSSFLTALNILQEYLSSDSKYSDFDIQYLLNNLEVFSRGPRDYKKIIHEYTNETFYLLFNKWLNSVDPLAIRKIAFFIAGMQLSLNIYGKRENKGIYFNAELYRGTLLNYSNVLNYVRNIGNIITFPSFLSTTFDVNIAKDFSQFYFPKEAREGLFSANYIIYINPKNNWIAQGFDISNISSYKEEKEILFQPFCFFRIQKVNVDMNLNMCYIYMELIGKKEIWEQKMNNKSSIEYNRNENFIELRI